MSDINVVSRTQRIIVDRGYSSVAVSYAGLPGPAGPTGPPGQQGIQGIQGVPGPASYATYILKAGGVGVSSTGAVTNPYGPGPGNTFPIPAVPYPRIVTLLIEHFIHCTSGIATFRLYHIPTNNALCHTATVPGGGFVHLTYATPLAANTAWDAYLEFHPDTGGQTATVWGDPSTNRATLTTYPVAA